MKGKVKTVRLYGTQSRSSLSFGEIGTIREFLDRETGGPTFVDDHMCPTNLPRLVYLLDGVQINLGDRNSRLVVNASERDATRLDRVLTELKSAVPSLRVVDAPLYERTLYFVHNVFRLYDGKSYPNKQMKLFEDGVKPRIHKDFSLYPLVVLRRNQISLVVSRSNYKDFDCDDSEEAYFELIRPAIERPGELIGRRGMEPVNVVVENGWPDEKDLVRKLERNYSVRPLDFTQKDI